MFIGAQQTVRETLDTSLDALEQTKSAAGRDEMEDKVSFKED